jgi:biotin carboxylase
VRQVAVVCPQARDAVAVRAAGVEARYAVSYVGVDLDGAEPFDARAFLAAAARLSVDGVVGTKDRSAIVASLVARELGLPGPDPAAVVRCQHKPTARRAQHIVAPAATPRFAELRNGAPPFAPPFFVKPAVGRLSQQARRIDDPAGLAHLPHDDAYARGWAELAELAGFPADAAGGFLAEELLVGDEVTLEGYVREGRVTVIGVTDSVMYPGTNSFERFEYPSRLGRERLAELAEVAARLPGALGFDDGFFNVEFVVPMDGAAQILELNARIASQFAPLVQALHGRSTYDALFALACGDDPRWETTQPPAGVAVSYVLRVFEDALVAAVPEPEDGVEVLVRPGLRLSEQGANDAASFRLAIVYQAGETREEAVTHARERARGLKFDLRCP